ncbi:helix-turn-helix transcriptional regulator [Spectribacter hydrogenoxidans]|uniref:Helix-turn-helix transcriptional regulator n=1 Tax=Spectribacter hydrogenoxidans TaxID=3075608 RepID=A0ABU3C0H9_9GAMM|nr:helix-turn-helix transcriptional regulator [Salinisphaera sp. W335]MDT0635073.1 helix-turn-helix transcriptional regulator [Salinisphaera sp. W335]
MARKYELSEADREAHKRLRAHFQQWKHRREQAGMPASQEIAAELMGRTQGAISHYLRPSNPAPIGAEITLEFARLFQVHPGEIRPDLPYPEIREESASYAADIDDPRIKALIQYFKGLTTEQQDEVIRDIQETKQRNESLLKQLLSISKDTG